MVRTRPRQSSSGPSTGLTTLNGTYHIEHLETHLAGHLQSWRGVFGAEQVLQSTTVSQNNVRTQTRIHEIIESEYVESCFYNAHIVSSDFKDFLALMMSSSAPTDPIYCTGRSLMHALCGGCHTQHKGILLCSSFIISSMRTRTLGRVTVFLTVNLEHEIQTTYKHTVIT